MDQYTLEELKIIKDALEEHEATVTKGTSSGAMFLSRDIRKLRSKTDSYIHNLTEAHTPTPAA